MKAKTAWGRRSGEVLKDPEMKDQDRILLPTKHADTHLLLRGLFDVANSFDQRDTGNELEHKQNGIINLQKQILKTYGFHFLSKKMIFNA